LPLARSSRPTSLPHFARPQPPPTLRRPPLQGSARRRPSTPHAVSRLGRARTAASAPGPPQRAASPRLSRGLRRHDPSADLMAPCPLHRSPRASTLVLAPRCPAIPWSSPHAARLPGGLDGGRPARPCSLPTTVGGPARSRRPPTPNLRLAWWIGRRKPHLPLLPSCAGWKSCARGSPLLPSCSLPGGLD
jgi:hypothetical protein